MGFEPSTVTISSRECIKKNAGKWGAWQAWDIIQVSEFDSTFKIMNGQSCLIIDGKVLKLARCEEESNTWILNQAIGKFSVIVYST